MKATTFAAALSFFGLSAAHTIFQKLEVDGWDNGILRGIRAPVRNFPIENVNDGAMACNRNLAYKDNDTIAIPAGAHVGTLFGHVIGGPEYGWQQPGYDDPDHPIAPSHKGPIIVYLAKVDDATKATGDGLRWFKIAESGLDHETGVWAVDTMIENNGWFYFDFPACIAPGDYLMRVELIALHIASTLGAAQFYMECAQIHVTGSGNSTGSNFVNFPGAYSAEDPGILIDVWGEGSYTPYTIPGPPVHRCGPSKC